MNKAALFSSRFQTRLGQALALVDELGVLRRLSFLEAGLEDELETQILADEAPYASYVAPDGPRTAPAREALEEVLAGRWWELGLPFQTRGTPLQEIVWEYLRGIPYGKTRTHAEVAAAIGSPESVRAVALAIGSNPIALGVPCHRAVGVRGEPTGRCGAVRVQRSLLELEQRCLEHGLAPPVEEPESLDAQTGRPLGYGLRIREPRP